VKFELLLCFKKAGIEKLDVKCDKQTKLYTTYVFSLEAFDKQTKQWGWKKKQGKPQIVLQVSYLRVAEVIS
jgi:hypothetical protein